MSRLFQSLKSMIPLCSVADGSRDAADGHGDAEGDAPRGRDFVIDRKGELLGRCASVYCGRFVPEKGSAAARLERAAGGCAEAMAATHRAVDDAAAVEAFRDAQSAFDAFLTVCGECLHELGVGEWQPRSEQKLYARKFSRAHEDWESWKDFFESRPAETLLNLMVVVAQQARYLLGKVIVRRETVLRRTSRFEPGWSRALTRWLESSVDEATLASRFDEAHAKLQSLAEEIRARRGW